MRLTAERVITFVHTPRAHFLKHRSKLSRERGLGREEEGGMCAKNRILHHPHLFTYSAVNQYEHSTAGMQGRYNGLKR